MGDAIPSWANLHVAAKTLAALKGFCEQAKKNAHIRGEWRHGAGSGQTILLTGPSSKEKHLAATLIAAELEMPLERMSLAALAGKYIGETEKNLSRILDAVEGHRVVLLFDEADALFGKRSGVEDAHDRCANAEASYLLQRLEAGGGITILMAKDDSFIDGAYLRRLTACTRIADPE